MYFADFETTTAKQSETKSWVWLWGIKGAMKGDKLHYDVDIKTFYRTLCEKKMKEVYFHNLSFDGNFIHKDLIKRGFKFRNLSENNNRDPLPWNHWEWICDEGGNIYALYVNYYGFLIKFYDSWKILMSSVKDLGKVIGKEKLDLDYDNYGTFKNKKNVPKEAIDYLERDIDVVIANFTKFIKLYKKKMTRASIAYDSFQEYYNESSFNSKRQFANDFGGWVWDYRQKKKVWQNVLSKSDWNFINKSYQGGWVAWKEAITNKTIETPNGISIDAVSLFPSIMEVTKIPYGKMLYSKPVGCSYATLKNIIIVNASIKNGKYPSLIRKKGGRSIDAKYLKNVQYEEYTYWEEELEFIKKYYDIDFIEIQTVYFKTKNVFGGWIGEVKHNKINARNDVERNGHKGVLNSVYGKFAQKIMVNSRIIIEDGNYVKKIKGIKYLCDIETNKVVKKLAKNIVRYGANGEFKHASFFKESEERKHIAVASYITSQARIALWKVVFANLDVWLYSDTDSCYFSGGFAGVKLHSEKFGYWKYEHKFSRFKVVRAKGYIFDATAKYKGGKWLDVDHIERKISGLSVKGKEKVNFDNFNLGVIIKGGKRVVKNVEGGKLIYDVDFTLGKEISDIVDIDINHEKLPEVYT